MIILGDMPIINQEVYQICFSSLVYTYKGCRSSLNVLNSINTLGKETIKK